MTTLASGFADFLLTEDGGDHRELEPAVLQAATEAGDRLPRTTTSWSAPSAR
jgi:hypothetical protein